MQTCGLGQETDEKVVTNVNLGSGERKLEKKWELNNKENGRQKYRLTKIY